MTENPKDSSLPTEDLNAESSVTELQAAAADWAPEAETEPGSEPQNPASERLASHADALPSQESLVTLVADPFGLGVLETSDAQRNEDEALDLDDLDESDELDDLETEKALDLQPVSETDSLLESLSQSLVQEEAKLAEELVEAEEATARLAAEIAEDEALTQALAHEAAQQEAEEIDPELAAALPQLPVADENGVLDLNELQSCIETLLFMSDKPLSLTRLQELLGPDFPHSLFQEAVTLLRDRYQSPAHGFELLEIAGGLQFRTKPGRAALAKKLAKVQTQRLSSGAMETLAIVSYKQPVLKEEIDQIRGVDSSHFIRTLMDRKLISIQGRSDLPGKPMVYGTTSEFLELFGLKDLQGLPSLRELEQMIPSSQSGDPDAPDADDPRVKEMRRLVAQMKADNTRLAYDPREDEKILKEIRERVSLIPSSTPWLDEQKALEKAEQEAAKEAAKAKAAGLAPPAEPTGELPLPEASPETLPQKLAEISTETEAVSLGDAP
jgi:segregation and condensation protein B